MKRGEILSADLGSTVGSEINKRRPVLIVSNERFRCLVSNDGKVQDLSAIQ
jgi:mRNA-degrading endonuclease toxin of MazEF toxin-antitoxin module